jgi:two-component system, OmpR family, sensor histidine kinase KdpD
VIAMSGGMSAGSTSTVSRGRLRVYLGVAPGAGKTYAMLAEAKHLAERGVDVVAGLVETHGRADTQAMLATLKQIPLAQTSHRGSIFDELDVDKVLARRPAVVLVDELAHTCVPGSRHEKRWEDVQELLTAGIDVITALNVQHIDSLNDAVEAVTGIAQHETVPDAVVAAADEIEFLDITPQQLRARIADTDVLLPGAAPHALTGFYTAERLAALRELATGWLQRRGHLGAAPPVALSRPSAAVASQRAVVALTGDPDGEHVLRRAAQIATPIGAELIGVHVREPTGLAEAEPAWLSSQRRLLGELGGHYTELAGIDVAAAVLDFARNENAHQLVLGATRRSRRQELLHGSVINKAVRTAGPVEVHVIPSRRPSRRRAAIRLTVPSLRQVPLPGLRRLAAWILAVIGPVAITVGLTPFRAPLGLTGALLCNLLAVLCAALLGGVLPALLATAVAVVLSDYFFTQPLHTLRVSNAVDVVALITFGIVALAVGGLVDVLTRQGVRTAHAAAEARNLARLAARAMASPRGLSEAVDSIRRTFDLDAAAVLSDTGTGWNVETAVGATRLQHPDQADYQVQIGTGRILVIIDARRTARETAPLQAFLTELRLARERALLQALPDNAAQRATNQRQAQTKP